MFKLPYGISNFKKIQVDNAFYIDRTQYIERLEELYDPTTIFLRPRRFGKSLFTTMLDYYYNIRHREEFEEIFGHLYIGQHPTPLASSFWVLNFHFAGIDTETPEDALRGFLRAVELTVESFARIHLNVTDTDVQNLRAYERPSDVMNWLIKQLQEHSAAPKIYVIIDEYDHFANELLAFSYEDFKQAVSKNGYIRKFYEQLKEGTRLGIIGRSFMTGVSAITLDSMTSGFNIGTNYSIDENFHDMLGFTEAEVIKALKYVQVPDAEIPTLLTNLKLWYNGYRFNENVERQLYNPSMILYFTRYYGRYQRYPRKILDVNIASDYSKVRNMFKVGEKEKENIQYLQEILEKGHIKGQLIDAFSLETEWTKNDLISLLFYNGILTIGNSALGALQFKIPNQVIEGLYFQYFNNLVLKQVNLSSNQADIASKIEIFAQENNPQPTLELVNHIVAQHGREDFAHFNETTLKAIFTSLFYVVGYYNIFSELEVRNSTNTKGRIDLLLMRRPPHQPNHQFVFELKYLRKKQAGQRERVKKEAVEQLQSYLQHDDYLKNIDHLRAYVILLVGHELEGIEVKVK